MALTFFDFDGTLTRCDTFIPYCLIALFHRPWRIFYIKPVVKRLIGSLGGEIARQELKEAFVGAFLGGAKKGDIARWNKVFLGLVLPVIVRERMFNMLLKHQNTGDRIYIVSASPDIYLKPLARLWRLDGIVCTTLEWKYCDLTGRILGKNCRGEEKARRVKALFTEKELKGSFGYGNSDGDQDLLELVSFGIRT